jgi:ferritin
MNKDKTILTGLDKLSDILKKKAEDYDVENEKPAPVEGAPAPVPMQEEKDIPGETPVPEQTKFLSEAVEKMLSQQIGNEMSAFYEYTAAKAWFAGQGLDGFAAWMAKQACDEMTHMNKVLMFLVECGCTPGLSSIEAPKTTYESVESVVEAIFQREKDVTANWRAIGKQAFQDFDSATGALAGWFVTEQIEEEDGVKAIHQKLQKAGGPGLLVIDEMLLDKYGGE